MSFAPPTLHPDGKAYEWREGRSPWDVEIADAPTWLIEEALSAAGGSAAPAGDDDPLIEMEVDPERQAQIEALAEIQAENEIGLIFQLENKRNTIDERDPWRNLGFALASVFKGTSYEEWALQVYIDWSLRWEVPEGKEKPSDEALEAEARGVWDYAKRGGAVTVKTARKLISDLPDLPPDPDLLEDVSEVAQAAATDDLSDIVLPGFLGEIQDKIRRGIERKAVMMPLAGAFAVQAALVGPYVTLKADDGSTPLNLFLTVFADTGAGKSTVRTVLKTHLNAAGRGNEMQTDPASGPAVHQALLTNKGVLTVMQDEAGRRKAENKASSNAHAAGAMTALMDLYGNEQIGIEQKTYSKVTDSKDAIAPVYLTFIRMSQRQLYLNSADELDSVSGELNRFLIFSEKETLELRDEAPDRDGLHELGPLGEKVAALFAYPVTTRIEITMTPEALAAYKAFGRTDCEAAYLEGGHIRQSWVRAKLHVKRLAGDIALSVAVEAGLQKVEGKPLYRAQVEAEYMQLAIRIVRANLNEVTGVAKRATDGEREALKEKIEAFIRKELVEKRGVGPEGRYVKYSVITEGVAALKRKDKRDKDDLFKDMVESDRLVSYIERRERGASGHPLRAHEAGGLISGEARGDVFISGPRPAWRDISPWR
jgi:hypothetical protein